MKLVPNSPLMPRLYQNCCQMRHEIATLADLDMVMLDEASSELSIDYELWCADYMGQDLADPFMGFGVMLHQGPCPWPFTPGSNLNGLTLAQFYLCWAYGGLGCALHVLSEKGCGNGGSCSISIDDIAILVVSVTKALMRAKYLLGSSGNCLAQQTFPPRN